MELDLNQEPLDQTHPSVLGLDSILNELESAHGRIEERIRQLEAVTIRARQRQRWRRGQTHPQSVEAQAGVPVVDARHGARTNTSSSRDASVERAEQARNARRRPDASLVARALGIETECNSAGNTTSGGFFDCNVCLKIAKDPILTCCGHLFCWSCFYQLSYTHSNVKECPACQGEVTDTSIIPIYGNGNSGSSPKSKETGLKVPPRPGAHRIESLRQQILSQAYSNEERIPLLPRARPSLAFRASDSRSNQHFPSLQVSRLLLQGAASFSHLSSALSSAMDSAERLVEDLEAYVHSHRSRRRRQSSPNNNDGRLFSGVATDDQPEWQTPDTGSETTSMVAPTELSFNRMDNILRLENQPGIDPEVNPAVLPSSSFRVTDSPRDLDTDNDVLPGARRRRLR